MYRKGTKTKPNRRKSPVTIRLHFRLYGSKLLLCPIMKNVTDPNRGDQKANRQKPSDTTVFSDGGVPNLLP